MKIMERACAVESDSVFTASPQHYDNRVET